ncbi:uncharacterized protein LOC126560804 [Anopheles maculipalpis]|uniref:uncharacterized protein LOC126560804 n=1 Tax=Anopheles maculipalpis TaxID=1496333 RepID=UPI00215980C5|nr:uncharacterized protein LOC126560804 [Anopheles maculipalpis]
MYNWIARFGVPSNITTDQGRQFESSLFKVLANAFGTKHIRTIAYHPQANGLIEGWHRTLKAAICCKDTSRWSEYLPLILLGLRTTFISDISASPAELVYGTTLTIPAEFFNEKPLPLVSDQSEFVRTLREAMNSIRPTRTAWHSYRTVFVSPDLSKCTHVFVRNDTVRPALTTPYHGPYQILTRNPKSFQILLHGQPALISIDCLKPAYTSDDVGSTLQHLPRDEQLLTNLGHDTPTSLTPLSEHPSTSRMPLPEQPVTSRKRMPLTRTPPTCTPSLQRTDTTTSNAPPPPILRHKDKCVSSSVTRSQRKVTIPLRYR